MSTATPAGILIVEDELIVANDLKHSLSEIGYDAFAIAASAEEAVACAEERWPDVVLMDIRIKGPEDGIQTATILKRKDPVIVVFLTAHADDPMIDRAKLAEPDGYLLKPVKLAELRSTIEMALHRRQSDAEKEKTRANEHRLFAITNNVPVAIAHFDRKGKVQFANSVFRSLVASRNDPIGASAMSFLGEDLYKASYPSRQSALFGQEATVPMDVLQGGVTRHYEVSYLPDRDACGTVIGVYALAHDVTEREQLASDLRRAHANWETILNVVPARIVSWNRDLISCYANAAAQAESTTLRYRTLGHHMRVVLGEARYRRAANDIESALTGQATAREEVLYDDDGPRYSNLLLIPDLIDGRVVGLHSLAFDVADLSASREEIRRLRALVKNPAPA
jgi:PAS domain S-box-containing protein